MNIVSGFVSDVNKRSDRNIIKYIQFGLEMLAVEIPMTIFIERSVFDIHIFPEFSSDSAIETGEFTYRICGGIMDGSQKTYSYMKILHITFVFFEMCDLVLWSSRALAHKFELNTGNPNKDTLEYMLVQCQKTEWMAIAEQLVEKEQNRQRGENDKEFVWIDFGSFHMFQGKIDVFQTELYKMRSRINHKITSSKSKGKGDKERMTFARCWDPNHVYYGNIYKDVNWLFAGSVFGGGSSAVKLFAFKMREKCLQILREKNTLMWEINVWAMIYRESPELFSLYPSDHSDIIFRGYSKN